MANNFNFYNLKNTQIFFFLCSITFFSCGSSKTTSNSNSWLYDEEIDSLTTILQDSIENSIEMSSSFELNYQNSIYQESIHTVLLHPNGFELGNPLIHLSYKDTLELSFDEHGQNPKNYAYTIIHCNSDWTPSDLLQNDYIEGFYEEPIRDYEFSFNTIQPYIHYKTHIPSKNLRPILSGNYVLIVFPEGHKEKPILSKRFMVMDEKIIVKGTVKRATDLEQRNYQHEIDFSIEHLGYTIDNPFGDITPVITQNNRWDNAIFGLQAVFVKDHEIIYDYEEENTFDGGNEYRFFDCQSLRYLSERLTNISFENDTNKIVLRTDQARSFQRYSGLLQDINGKRLIRVQEGTNNQTEADYTLVSFTLPYDYKITHGDLYVFGQISDFGFPESHKMIFNKEKSQYEANLYLKQGYYNYEYILKKYDGEAISRFIEGTHYQTDNDYYIYIYHRPTGEYYDQLIGIQKLTSKGLL